MEKDLQNLKQLGPLLEKLGLSSNEISCYLASVELGKAKVRDIARVARVHRVNTYAAIKKLVERGLLEQEVARGKLRMYSASSEALRQTALVYQKHAAKLRWKIEDILPSLQGFEVGRGKPPGLLLFEGPQALIQILERSLLAPIGSEVLELCLLTDKDHVVSTNDYSLERLIPERIKRQLYKKIICLEKGRHRNRLATRDKVAFRETRYFPAGYAEGLRGINLSVYGDEVGWFLAGHYAYGIVIKSQELAEVMRKFFTIVWGISKKSSR